MKNLIDLHTHTISSGHAYSTLQENIIGAKQRGLKYIGTSDHAPQMPGGAHSYHFGNARVIPSVIDGINVLKGVELNIMDKDGTVDLPNKLLSTLDYSIASMHLPCYSIEHSLEDNMNAYLGVCKNPHILILGHPDDDRYACDYDELAKMAKQYNKIIEINNSSLKEGANRKNGKENITKILMACKKHDTMVVLNSDAHISFHVGDIELAEQLLVDTQFPLSLVLNYNEELIQSIFYKK